MKNRKQQIKELEKNIEIQLYDKSLLDIATTHSSYAHNKKDVKFNERFEFLGDSILQMCITEHLFKNFSNKSEGELTKIRSLIVCESSLFEVARQWDLGQFINMSRGEELTGGRTRVSIQSDCVEALIAAVYLDKGIEETRDFILKNFEELIRKAINNEIVFDYKTKLQEVLQKNKETNIMYELRKFEGPPHRRIFYVDVLVNDVLMGSGQGYSKKEAEQIAAKGALDKVGV